MSKQFITDVIQRTVEITGVASANLASEIIDAIKAEIVHNRRLYAAQLRYVYRA